MDMLVLIMLALFLMIIAFMVVIFVYIRKNSCQKVFNKNMEDEIDSFDDDEDDSIDIPLVLPKLNFENQNEINLNQEDVKEEEKVTTDLKEEVNDENHKVEVLDIDEEKSNNIPLKNEVVSQKKNEEVVNILINKKNYIFLANNNKVAKNDHLKLIIDNKIYFGIVTKPNYYRDINAMRIKPKKLIVVKNKPKQIIKNDRMEESDNTLDLIPIKKVK